MQDPGDEDGDAGPSRGVEQRTHGSNRFLDPGIERAGLVEIGASRIDEHQRRTGTRRETAAEACPAIIDGDVFGAHHEMPSCTCAKALSASAGAMCARTKATWAGCEP